MAFIEPMHRNKPNITYLLFHATSNFLYLFVAICKFPVALRFGNDQIGANFGLT